MILIIMAHENLIEITEQTHPVIIDLAYASDKNFTGKPIYTKSACFLHKDAEKHLQIAISIAHSMGYRFKIFDAFRPLEAQWALWHHTPNDNYVSHPERGSIPHCRGVAVDLTLIDSNNHELDMGTPFDDFETIAHHGNLSVSQEAITNRCLLMGIMTTAGWDFFRNEWWHYQLFNVKDNYIALDDHTAQTNLCQH